MAEASASGQPLRVLLRGALAISVAIVVYATLLPFAGWRVPETVSWTGVVRPYQTELDLILNVVAYVPLGLLLTCLLLQTSARRPFAKAALLASAVSLLLETLQLFLPGRVAALHDWLANSAGGGIGALLAASAHGRRIGAAIATLRERWLAPGNAAEWGLLLLILWLVAQSNPAVPFFEAGQLANELTRDWQTENASVMALLPQVIAIALNVCGFALFLAVWVHTRIFAGLPALLALATGLMVKFLAAGLMLKAPLLESWLGPASALGLIVGYFFALVLLGTSARTRLFLATLLIFAGGLMARLSGTYEGLEGMLRLFDRPHPQLGAFAGLTRWLNELWPVAAFVYLVTLFVRGDGATRNTP